MLLLLKEGKTNPREEHIDVAEGGMANNDHKYLQPLRFQLEIGKNSALQWSVEKKI